MGDHGLKRKDTTKGPPLRVLSLDGGGVRGYSMLVLLQELMHKTFSETEGRAPRRDEIPKPCDYFDLIAGTGTGGLIAIMLGRLRLDLETCKETYIRMTRKVFETDKTIFGMPYRSTLFKASKLEEAIKECVREHTIYTSEGNDGTAQGGRETPMHSEGSARFPDRERRFSIASSVGSNSNPRSPSSTYVAAMRWGNANASLYDARENRCKTAVTAVYKDTDPRTGGSILLRSYDSRKEPPVEFNCTIWEAGRATSAIGLSFKPIRIGTSTFVDEGAGNYNPSPQIMDEAIQNEWPGREIGVFVSVGTGKRPSSASGGLEGRKDWWEGFLGSNIGDFAEFRRTLIGKIEACEETHQYMRTEHLSRRGVNPENYYRINVEVGVGDFGMNEWNRVSDISSSTRMYLARPEVKQLIENAAGKMARIERAKRRFSHYTTTVEMDGSVHPALRGAAPSPPNPLAVELPGDQGYAPNGPAKGHGRAGAGVPQYENNTSAPADDKFAVLSPNDVPPAARRSNEHRPHYYYDDGQSSSGSLVPSPLTPSPRRSHESAKRAERAELAYRTSSNPLSSGGASADTDTDTDGATPTPSTANPPPLPPQIPHSGLAIHDAAAAVEAPPRPPKTPIQTANYGMSSTTYPYVSPISPHAAQPSAQQMRQRQSAAVSIASSLVSSPRQSAAAILPYPDDDGPPVVDMARKPHFVRR